MAFMVKRMLLTYLMVNDDNNNNNNNGENIQNNVTVLFWGPFHRARRITAALAR